MTLFPGRPAQVGPAHNAQSPILAQQPPFSPLQSAFLAPLRLTSKFNRGYVAAALSRAFGTERALWHRLDHSFIRALRWASQLQTAALSFFRDPRTISSNTRRSSAPSPAPSSNSGRLRQVFSSAQRRRHLRISSWFPPSNTSGTSHPRN